MKLHTLVLSFTLPLIGFSAGSLLAEEAPTTPAPADAPAIKLDFGDFSSATLTNKAWAEQGAGNAEAALAYTAKCIEMYAAQAKEMQATLTAPAAKEQAFDYWALNDVGTCYFIAGLVKESSGDKAGALESYKTLVNELSFAQCWDTKGWFWSPADAAKGKLKTLEFEAMSEAPDAE